jgi:hypothetical protein
LLALQAAYAAWFEALPESLRGTATADALAARVLHQTHGVPMMLG